MSGHRAGRRNDIVDTQRGGGADRLVQLRASVAEHWDSGPSQLAVCPQGAMCPGFLGLGPGRGHRTGAPGAWGLALTPL